MKKIMILVALLPMSAFGWGGYYNTRASNCDMAAMRAELDRATAQGRAVITTVRCNNPAPCRF